MPMRELGSIVVLVHVVSFCFGCIVGSFLNVVVWRVPRGESLLSPPSHCPTDTKSVPGRISQSSVGLSTCPRNGCGSLISFAIP